MYRSRPSTEPETFGSHLSITIPCSEKRQVETHDAILHRLPKHVEWQSYYKFESLDVCYGSGVFDPQYLDFPDLSVSAASHLLLVNPLRDAMVSLGTSDA